MAFSAAKPISRARARAAMAFNLLAAPGLGSLLCRRWIAGTGQLLLTLIGFTVFMDWFAEQMTQYYGQISGNVPVRPIAWIAETGAIIVAVAWVWSAVTSVSLLHEASQNKLNALKNFAAPPLPRLEPAQVAALLLDVRQWTLNGNAIARTFLFKDFPAAMKFTNAVAELAEQEWHHPDIDIRWNKVTLTLSTHDAGGLTKKDFNLARQFDQLSLR